MGQICRHADMQSEDFDRYFDIKRLNFERRRQVLEAKLRDDKKRTEDLICSIFPAKVAHCLLKDLPVEAEQFPMISCLFSDIVGFTALCSNETVVAMDIIRLLNRLYVQFDALTNIHQVYKVSSVPQSYTVSQKCTISQRYMYVLFLRAGPVLRAALFLRAVWFLRTALFLKDVACPFSSPCTFLSPAG